MLCLNSIPTFTGLSIQYASLSVVLSGSDEFELEFPKLNQAELKGFRAELGHFNFRAETELTICMSISSKRLVLLKNYNQISQFCASSIMIIINFMIIYLN